MTARGLPIVTAMVASLVLAALVVPAGAAARAEAPAITISPTVGPPTTKASVAGAGFVADEAVDVFFDTSMVTSAHADGLGALAPVTITVPKSAVPGTHWVSAVGAVSDVLTQTGFLVRANWSQFHFSANHRSANPYENVLSAQTVHRLRLAWTTTIGGATWSSPAVADGSVFIGTTDGYLYALDAATGVVLWRAATGRVDLSSPAISDGRVYIGSETGMYALDEATGQLLWHETDGSEIEESSPAVLNGVVYVGTWGGNVFGYDAATGAQRWMAEADDMVRSSPAIGSGRVFVTEWEAGPLYAYAVQDGRLLWSHYVFSYASSSAAVANGTVYVGCWGDDSRQKGVCAYDAVTGAFQWRKLCGNLDDSTPAVSHGVLFVEPENGAVVAFDALTGTRLWRTGLGTFSASTPAVANGVVYASNGNGRLVALNTSTGTVLWRGRGPAVTSSPAVADGSVYVGSDGGTVSAYRLPTAQQPPPRPSLADLVRG